LSPRPPWRIERVTSPGIERIEDHLHVLMIGTECVCAISQAGDRPDEDAELLINLLSAASDLLRALIHAHRAILRTSTIHNRAWLLAEIAAAFAKVNGKEEPVLVLNKL
jgi:predicted phage gp36 major capsid-like protein